MLRVDKNKRELCSLDNSSSLTRIMNIGGYFMERMNEELINKLEKVLNITFYEWQRKYLLDEPMLLDMKITGRCTGKTLVFVIKQLFERSETLLLRNRTEVLNAADWWCCEQPKKRALSHPYLSFYRNTLKDVYEKLNKAGVVTRKVIF